MIAQKQENSVQFRRLIDAIVAPAAVWPLVVAAAFLSPRGWPLGDATARNARRSPPASDGVRDCLDASTLTGATFPEISFEDALVVYSDKHFI
jgi:hypothetical protein